MSIGLNQVVYLVREEKYHSGVVRGERENTVFACQLSQHLDFNLIRDSWGVHGKYGEQIYFRGNEVELFQHRFFVCFCWKAAVEFTEAPRSIPVSC